MAPPGSHKCLVNIDLSIYLALFRTVLHHNQAYFWQYVFCETLNAVLVVAMIFVTDAFLGGRFIAYGKRVWEHYWVNDGGHAAYGRYHGTARAGPMCSLFPTVTS